MLHPFHLSKSTTLISVSFVELFRCSHNHHKWIYKEKRPFEWNINVFASLPALILCACFLYLYHYISYLLYFKFWLASIQLVIVNELWLVKIVFLSSNPFGRTTQWWEGNIPKHILTDWMRILNKDGRNLSLPSTYCKSHMFLCKRADEDRHRLFFCCPSLSLSLDFVRMYIYVLIIHIYGLILYSLFHIVSCSDIYE